MAYCSNCGAYIPDGETVCIACGENRKAATQKAVQNKLKEEEIQRDSSSSTEKMRRELEDKQMHQREKSQEWAKQAYENYRKTSTHSTSNSTGERPSSERKASAESRKTLGKVLAVMSYISVFCFLPFLITPDDDFAKFHGKQGILLLALSIIIDVLGFLRAIAFFLSIARIYLMIKGILNVLADRKEKLPYIGQFADKF